MISSVAFTGHMLARNMLDKLERTGTVDVFLVPFGTVCVQILFAVNKVKRCRHGRDK